MTDLMGLQKPLYKLIDVLADGCSWFFEPIKIKRIADANAYASSINDISNMKSHLCNELFKSMDKHLASYREEHQMQNIANIYSMAMQELQMIQHIDDRQVSQEWSALFFDYSKDVSDEDVQIIWSKILASEIARPGTFFKRTLSVLKNIEPFEAKWFVEACRFAGDAFISLNALDYFQYNKMQTLIDCGLINAGECRTTIPPEANQINFKSHSIQKEDASNFGKPLFMSGFSMTDAGHQLYGITNTDSDVNFLTELKNKLEESSGLKLVLVKA